MRIMILNIDPINIPIFFSSLALAKNINKITNKSTQLQYKVLPQ